MGSQMEKGGAAWRGYFPVGGELTSGRPDVKVSGGVSRVAQCARDGYQCAYVCVCVCVCGDQEGIYFGTELPDDDVRVRAGTPLHGRNMWPVRAKGAALGDQCM